MAIVNGRSGTFNIYTENQYINGYVQWQETYDDSTYIATNKSTVTINAYLHRTNIYSGETYLKNIKGQRIAYFGSETVVDNSNLTLTIAGNTSSSGGAYTKVFTASKEITHDSNGNKSLDVGFYMTNVETGAGATAFKVAKTTSNATLTTIPRYATSIQNVNSKTETTITMNWSSDNIIDYVWYSTDWGTNWVAVGAVNGTSGSYTITKDAHTGGNLTAYTTYNIMTRVRRKDSQLTTNSSKLSVTTEDYPYCTDSPNFTIGSALTLKFHNPLGRSITVNGYGADGSKIFNGTTTGTSLTGFNDSNSVNSQYASIPNSKSGTYKVEVIYGSSTKTRNNGNTYSIRGTETPTIGTITYADTNTTVTAITGNNQHIVQNQSNLKVTFSSATAKNSAKIVKHTFTLNGVTKINEFTSGNVDFGTVNSAKDLTLTVTVTDSRGLTASTTKTITMLAHSSPTAIVTLNRLNNYEDESYLTVDGSVSSVNNKNTMAIKYRYKVSGGSYGSFTTISDNTKQTLSLNKENVYIFNVVVTDSFGTTYNQEHILNKGVFPLFIDIEKNSVGINCLPTNEDSLEIDGTIYTGNIKCKNLFYTPYTESNKLTRTASGNEDFIVTNCYTYLEANKTYTFSCETDGVWGRENADAVEAYLLKDKTYNPFIYISSNPCTFSVSSSGYYFLRCDIMEGLSTHSFWNFQIEEGNTATRFVESKEFSNKQNYSLEEQVVGTWIDGKTIYRKVINFGTLPNATSKIYDVSGLKIDKCINITGFAYRDTDKTSFPLPYTNIVTSDGIQIYYTTANNLPSVVITTGIDRSNTVGYPIIEYTKKE